MSLADIELVVPGLLDIPAHEFAPEFPGDQLPAINRCLTLATRVETCPLSLDETISECLSLERRMLPMADMLETGAAEPSGNSMLVEPVYLKPDINNVTLYPVERQLQTGKQVGELIDALGNEFSDDLLFTPVSDCVYHVRFKTLAAPDYYPHPLSILGKSINPFIELARSDLDWYRLLTEIQMFLHDHPVNRQRQAGGFYPVNSLWFWGGGTRWQCHTDQVIYTDDELFRRFFDGSAKQVTTLEDSSDFHSPALVISTRLLSVLKSVDHHTPLNDILVKLEETVFSPAVEAVKRRGSTLRLRAGWQQDFFLHPLHSWRFWRSKQTVVSMTGSATE